VKAGVKLKAVRDGNLLVGGGSIVVRGGNVGNCLRECAKGKHEAGKTNTVIQRAGMNKEGRQSNRRTSREPGVK